MDDYLRRELDRIYRRHRVAQAAREALERLLEAALDPRMQLTHAITLPPAAPLLEKSREEEEFEDLGRLGLGGMGEVRRVREPALGRVIAMKILRDHASREWFEREATLTASLDHPGVLPVYRLGHLPDGTPYFTLREARGQTLREALSDPGQWTQRRLLDALRRVADTVASAHAHGVVHRDIKPENILLGEFGAVWLLDWGIACRVGDSADGPVGTPRYMAPEQIRGGPLGPGVDVWALGAVLYEILAGRPAYVGDAHHALSAIQRGPPGPLELPVDPALAGVVTRAMSARPERRYADAAAFAGELGGWLDGARAREEAGEILALARLALSRSATRREDATRWQAEADRQLAPIPTWVDASVKQEAWQLEERARQAIAEAIMEDEHAVELAHAALRRCPDLTDAHRLLADNYRARLEEAERRGDPVAQRLEARLRAHDTGEHSAWLAGDGRLTIIPDAPDARLRVAPVRASGRRAVVAAFEELPPGPVVDAPLGRGSWLVEIEAPGRATVRYPVMMERAGAWRGVPPGERATLPIWMPREDELGPDEVYVPAGWCSVGRDPAVTGARAGGDVWVDGFVIQRFAVTNADWLAYVNALTEAGELEAAREAVPKERVVSGGGSGAMVYVFEGGRWRLGVDIDGDAWQPDWPVFLITWYQAVAYARWKASSTGLPWRLLMPDEFEKAARGVDARLYPWGDGFDPSFACIRASFSGSARPAPITSSPLDESIYGVRGLAGCCRTWVGGILSSGEVEMRGSYWNAAGLASRSASRYFDPPSARTVACGVRLARSVGPSRTP